MKPDKEWKPLGLCLHPCIKIYYVANLLLTVLTKTTMAPTHISDIQTTPPPYSWNSDLHSCWAATGTCSLLFPRNRRNVSKVAHPQPYLSWACKTQVAILLEKALILHQKYPGNYAFGSRVYDTKVAFVTFLGSKEFKVLTSGFNSKVLQDRRQKQQRDKSKSLIRMYVTSQSGTFVII